MPQKRIVIDPVTRIEGHSKISIHLDEQGHVEEAYFHVTQFRGFEKFCEGRPFYEMPSLMARICGICPVSHLIAIATRTLDWFKREMERFREEIRSFANFPTLFMGLVGENGGLEHYDGKLRFLDSGGHVIADYPNATYMDNIAEIAHPWSYLKTSFYKPNGYPDGIYRVGPLARLNLIDSVETPLAGQEWAEFRELDRGPVLSSFYYHYARLIEILYGLEKIEHLLSDPEVLDINVRAHASVNNREGIGVSEAPRGTLLHHYKVDGDGLITWSNLIIATGHNNAAMNRGVLQVARHFVQGNHLTEGMLNRVEAVIRAFDPCLSCSTHAAGRIALEVELRGHDGALLDSRTT
jgi:NAD-reducing hydrogenase large subunit